MMSKSQGGKKFGEDSSNGKLLSEIEAISKALYSDKARSRSSVPTLSSQSKSVAKSQLPKPKSKAKIEDDDPLKKEKKSIWNWKPFRSITQIRSRKFNLCFTLQVHSIEGLSPNFGDLSLRVHWKRRDGELVTRQVRVSQGRAEFDEELKHSCSINGSTSGPDHSAKYESKHFLLYASIFGFPELDLGKHRVDLTRLLPLALEELEEEKSSGKWSTSYRLSGKAKGANLNVSFTYSILENGNDRTNGTNLVKKSGLKSGASNNQSLIRRSGSLPSRSSHTSSLSVESLENIKDLHEILPTSRSELFDSVNTLYSKLDEENLSKSINDDVVESLDPVKEDSVSSDSVKNNVEAECEVGEFSKIDEEEVLPKKPVKEDSVSSDSVKNNVEAECEVGEFSKIDEEEVLPKKPAKLEEVENEGERENNLKEDKSNEKELLMKELESALKNVTDSLKEESDYQEPEHELPNEEQYPDLKSNYEYERENNMMNESRSKEDNSCENDLLMKELELALQDATESDYQESEGEIQNDEHYRDLKANYKDSKKGKSLSLDLATESVAGDFLNMLGIEHSPFGPSSESEPDSPRERLLRQFEKETLANGCSLFNFDLDEDLEQFNFDDQDQIPSGSKSNVTMLEDLETEVLMHEFGLNEKSFENSPPENPSGFGSPIDLPPPQLPPLGEGLGPYVQTDNGGFLRSMNPQLFSDSKSKGSLIMQVSSPVVVPAEMGSGIMEILQRLASVGIEKLSMQANKLMPLEDVNGMTMQQIAWETAPSLEAPDSHVLSQHEDQYGQNTSYEEKRPKQKKSAPTSTQFKSSSSSNTEIDSEYVSLEDLAPLAMDKIEALSIEGLRIQADMSEHEAPSNIGGTLGLEGAGGLQLMDIKDKSDDVDGLMGLSLTLDEWMKLDSGEIDDGDDEISERTSRILAAHHASDLMRVRSKSDRRRSRKCGLLGNNFTVALMVQLRDPVRNYEPVGAPMLALIQVERVFVPPKPKIYGNVSIFSTKQENDDENESAPIKKVPEEEEKVLEEVVPQFKITEVHVAGFKADPVKKKLWGSKTPEQSGSRWLVANGMGKNNKHPFMKSKGNNSKSSLPSNSNNSKNTTTVQPGETLWSISARVHGNGDKWKDLAKLNPHIRNPNVIFPNETIRLS